MPRFPALLAILAAALVAVPATAQKQIILQPGVRVQPRNTPTSKPEISDEEALKSAGLSATEGEKLIGYLKMRTVSDAEQGKINGLIQKLGAELFDDRIKAGEELELFGPAAIGLLKAAEKNTDPEIAYQAARVLRRMEKIPHSAVAAAAVRAVVKSKPPGAATALLGFLPLADSDSLADDIRGALVALAAPAGKPDPAIVAALQDPSPIRRGAAYQALIEGGPETEIIRIKDSYEQVKTAIRKEADEAEKFRGLWLLVTIARDKDAVPDLIAMVPQLPRGRIWQLEDLLLQLAGEVPEGGRFGKTAEALAKARDAWAGWWTKKEASIDLVKVAYKPRMQGITDLVEWSPNLGTGRFVSLGPDLKVRNTFNGNSLFDAKPFPNGRYMCIENYSQMIERDVEGNQFNTRNLNNPLSAEPLPDGGSLIATRQFIYEYSKDGKQEWVYQRQNVADVVGVCRLPNGETLFITQTGKGENCFRLDAKGKLVAEKGITVGRMTNYGYSASVTAIGDDKILMCEPTQVAEYEWKTGKIGWKFSIQSPTCAQRLPNGNTLISAQFRTFEVDPSGDILWEYKPKDNSMVLKAYRR